MLEGHLSVGRVFQASGIPVGCVSGGGGGAGEGQLALLGSGVVGWLPGSRDLGESLRAVSQEGRKIKIPSACWLQLWAMALGGHRATAGRKAGRRERGGGERGVAGRR